jgi:hypothetical protein
MANFRIYNETLAPELWDASQHLDPKVRMNLLQMAYDFYGKTNLPAPVLDVYLMGSIANYNWTKDSDVDVHVIINYAQLQMPEKTAIKTVKTAGAQWNIEHEVIIKGHKVEMNLQNATEQKPYVTGIYSLVKNQWIRKPFKMSPQVDRNILKVQYQSMRGYVQNALDSRDREQMKAAKKYLDAYRQYGLDTYGELSYENLVFKILRARGVIKKLKDGIVAVYDKTMSVDEVGYRDIKKHLPDLDDQDYWGKFDSKGQFRLDMLTMDNLNALKDKAARMIVGYESRGKPEWAEVCKADYIKYDNELKRRIQHINSPVTESPMMTKKGKTALAGDKPLKGQAVEEVTGNIVVIRQGKGGGFLPEGWTLVYFMDSDESAQAMKQGQIPYLMVPRGTFMSGGSPITDIWLKKFQKPGTHHILGVIEGHSDEETIFIDMVTVRPGWKRNHIAKLMMDRLKKTFPEAKLTTSTQTDAGQKLFKSYGGEQQKTNESLKSSRIRYDDKHFAPRPAQPFLNRNEYTRFQGRNMAIKAENIAKNISDQDIEEALELAKQSGEDYVTQLKYTSLLLSWWAFVGIAGQKKEKFPFTSWPNLMDILRRTVFNIDSENNILRAKERKRVWGEIFRLCEIKVQEYLEKRPSSEQEPIGEGFGFGIPEDDRLKIKNEDNSTRRWQVRSKNVPSQQHPFRGLDREGKDGPDEIPPSI